MVTPDGILDDAVVRVEDGRIADVSSAGRGRLTKAAWILPGFVDIHVHGGGGHTFTTGDPSEALGAPPRSTGGTAPRRCSRAW